MSLIYTNPKWDIINKKILWNSFDQELELAKIRPIYNNFKFPISYNKKIFPTVILGNPKWNNCTKKLEWNIIYRK